MSGDGTELAIRRQLLINKVVEAIVILPRNMFYSTDISVTLWILNNNKKARTVEQNGRMVRYRNREDEVLFIDLRQWGEPFEKKYIQFSQEQIQQIAENFHNWQRVGYEQTYHDEPEYCYSATLDEIEKTDRLRHPYAPATNGNARPLTSGRREQTTTKRPV